MSDYFAAAFVALLAFAVVSSLIGSRCGECGSRFIHDDDCSRSWQ